MATDFCTRHTLTASDGAQLTVCAHGGHVLGWTPAGGQPRLWLSPAAECGPGLAIRGGVPVIFPQFAGRGPLPKHGVARNRGWQVAESHENGPAEAGARPGARSEGGARPDAVPAAGGAQSGAVLGAGEGAAQAGAALWRARLVDDDATRAIWPHRFELTLTARAEGDRLDITLGVRNTDDVPWSFTAALHSYLALGDPEALLHGLGGRIAEDNVAGGQPTTLGAPGEPLRATTPRDVAVLDAAAPLTLDDPVLGLLVMTAEGFGDWVVWNPGPGHGLRDVPDGDERNFVCVEPAALTPVLIQPEQIWTGRQTLLARTR